MIEKYLDSEEFKRLVSALIAVLGCLVLAALFGSIVVPGLRNANKPVAPPVTTPAGGQPGWLNEEESPPQRGVVIPPVDPMTLLEPSPDLTDRGRELFQKNCAQCHGPRGQGDGPAAVGMKPKPRDLSTLQGWKNGPDIPGIFRTLAEGIQGTSMSSYDYLTQKDRMSLVHYVRTLASSPPPGATPQALEALKRQLGSSGETIPNRIRVSTAMSLLASEYQAPVPIVIRRGARGAGTGVLERVLLDPRRAAQFLGQSQSWKAGPRALAVSIVRGAPENGFSTSAATLSPAEWQDLFSDLVAAMSPH